MRVDGEEGRGIWRREGWWGSSLNPRAQVDSDTAGGRVCRAVQLEGSGGNATPWFKRGAQREALTCSHTAPGRRSPEFLTLKLQEGKSPDEEGKGLLGRGERENAVCLHLPQALSTWSGRAATRIIGTSVAVTGEVGARAAPSPRPPWS